MKRLITFSIATLLVASLSSSSTVEVVGKGPTLIDMINESSEIPVYFISNDVYFDQWKRKVMANGTESFSTCSGIDESIPNPSEFDEAKAKVVSELNKAFKTDKFVLKEDNLPRTGKDGVLGSDFTNALQPPLKSLDISDTQAPFIVLCALVTSYNTAGLLKTDDISKAKLMEYKSKGVELYDELSIVLQSYLNVRMVSYDGKKDKISYADPMIWNLTSDAPDENLHFDLSSCPLAMSDLTSKASPANSAPRLMEKIEGMFDDRAARLWKKQK
jgi:hypothetical protein